MPTTMRNSDQHLRGARAWLFRVVVLGLWSALGTGLGLWIVPRAIDSWRSWDDRAYSIQRERRSLRSDNPPSPESFFPTEALSRPPIVTGFQILSAQEVGERILDYELVLGVEINGEARAYPLNMMNGPQREVFNDTVGGRPIAATWCHLCHTAIVFARVARDKTLTLGVSGLLWEGNLVMFDQETETLWSQMMGEAMRGPLTGERLEIIPSALTDWRSWVSHHPGTSFMYMDRTADVYQKELIHREIGLVLGYVENGISRVWDFAPLYDRQVVNDQVGDRAVLVTMDVTTGTAVLFDRTIDGEVFEFELLDGMLLDQITGSQWEMLTGRAVAGDLRGKRLTLLPAFPSDGAVWQAYHPGTTRWQWTGP